ncbi:hypothetical protein OSSY52_22370 [Tepiditoga spiralis]|uniref:DNA-binding protein n=1 Tax=Tepiditoga spiralis TaxID=2108365 RepID=A0A7G1G9C6_9BACT|nr:DNA-binding protein [Tepiditoga spiralis]BBE32096.1 hypothetical protein OSSY52_22370 [Tepiditoga spiralis]
MKKAFLILMFSILSLIVYSMTIEEVRSQKQLDGVEFEGIVTVEPGLYDINHIFLQDETGGVDIYTKSIDLTKMNIKRGYKVKVNGYVWEHKGNLEIVVDPDNPKNKIEIISKEKKIINPISVKTDDINKEKYEGKLIKVSGKITKIEGQDFLMDDGSGEGMVWIREGTGIDTTIFRKGIKIEVTGIQGQYLSKRELWPRDKKDIIAEDLYPPKVRYYSMEDDKTVLVMFNEPILRNLKANKTVRILKNSVEKVEYLTDSIIKITAKNPINNQKIIFRLLQDLNGNKLNMSSISVSYEKNKKIKNVLFDAAHAQKAGNADWVTDGAFSDFGDKVKELGMNFYSEKLKITKELLEFFGILILPEPNAPYTKEEINAIINFVKNGGGIFIISDHGHSDRNGNGWDSVRIFNEFVDKFGFEFVGDNLEEAPLAHILSDEITKGIKKIGLWNGSSIKVLKKDVKVLIRTSENKPFMIKTNFEKGSVIAIGDSSPFDDGTGDAGDMLHNGWKWGDDSKLAENVLKYIFNELNK